jgi:hypothetical protein
MLADAEAPLSGRPERGEAVNCRFVVTETTTSDDIAGAGRPDPLYCKPGLVQHARFLADLIDAEVGGETSCAGAGIGYVPEILELDGVD